MGVTSGDWVTTAVKPGLWQVYRIESDFYEDRFSLDEPKVRSGRTLAFARRIVDGKWKKAFETDVFEASVLSPLSREQRERLDELLASDDALREAFEAYDAEPVDLITNLAGAFSSDELREWCDAELARRIEFGMTLDEVLELLERSPLAAKLDDLPTQATLQLVSPDHLRRGDEFVHTQYDVLDF